MPVLVLEIDATRAKLGAEEFGRATDAIQQKSARLAASVDGTETAVKALSDAQKQAAADARTLDAALVQTERVTVQNTKSFREFTAETGKAAEKTTFLEGKLAKIVAIGPQILAADLLARIAGFGSAMEFLQKTVSAVANAIRDLGADFLGLNERLDGQKKRVDDATKSLDEYFKKLKAVQDVEEGVLQVGVSGKFLPQTGVLNPSIPQTTVGLTSLKVGAYGTDAIIARIVNTIDQRLRAVPRENFGYVSEGAKALGFPQQSLGPRDIKEIQAQEEKILLQGQRLIDRRLQLIEKEERILRSGADVERAGLGNVEAVGVASSRHTGDIRRGGTLLGAALNAATDAAFKLAQVVGTQFDLTEARNARGVRDQFRQSQLAERFRYDPGAPGFAAAGPFGPFLRAGTDATLLVGDTLARRGQGKLTNEEISQRLLKDLETKIDKINDRARAFATTISGSLEDAILHARNLGDALSGIFQNLAQEVLHQFAAKPLADFLFTSFGGTTPSARGNVFENGNLIQFATGGVINGPHYFGLRDGLGVAGEAGPEAILPLRRRNGRLGVEGGGQSVVIHMSVQTPDANSFRSASRHIAEDLKRKMER